MRIKDNNVVSKTYKCQNCGCLLQNNPMGTSGICTACGGTCKLESMAKPGERNIHVECNKKCGRKIINLYHPGNPIGDDAFCVACGGRGKEVTPKGFPPGGALYCIFACYNCGCTQGCNNITRCHNCHSTHFYVKEVCFDGFSISVEPPKPNSCMAADAMILVPDKDTFEGLKGEMWNTGKAYVRGLHELGHPITCHSQGEWNPKPYGNRGMTVRPSKPKEPELKETPVTPPTPKPWWRQALHWIFRE